MASGLPSASPGDVTKFDYATYAIVKKGDGVSRNTELFTTVTM